MVFTFHPVGLPAPPHIPPPHSAAHQPPTTQWSIEGKDKAAYSLTTCHHTVQPSVLFLN